MVLRAVPVALVLSALSAALSAAPKLRLESTTVGPISVAQGANGPAQVVEAFNAGDGALNLRLSSTATWVVPTVGTARGCSQRPGQCLPLQMALQTQALARGMHTAIVTVADPNAVDAPQTITVTVQMGGGVPDSAALYVAPNGSSDAVEFVVNRAADAPPLGSRVTTQTGGPWLSLALYGAGSFSFVVPYRIVATHQPGMGAGTYNGSIVTSNSRFAPDNKTINVTLRVTSDPIAQLSKLRSRIRVPQTNGAGQDAIVVTNRGLGALNVSTATVNTTSGGTWLAAAVDSGVVVLTARSGSLTPGVYQGSVTVAGNFANGSQTVPVEMEVVPRGAPLAAFEGVVNNATFARGEPLSQGGIVAVFGEQFISGQPVQAASLPLPTSLGGVRVLVNNSPAPVYFVSAGQINFQLPFTVPVGDAIVRVERDGEPGNAVGIRVAASAPRILRLGVQDYGIIVNQDGTYPMPPTPGLPSRPARRGEALVIYCLGLGPTVPVVSSGEAAPLSPLAQVPQVPSVQFGIGSIAAGIATEPLFAGLTPNFVGLYQVNVVIPDDAPSGNAVGLALQVEGRTSNRVAIAIE